MVNDYCVKFMNHLRFLVKALYDRVLNPFDDGRTSRFTSW